MSRFKRRENPEACFWSTVQKSDDDGCWLWTGATNQHGYGKHWMDGKKWYAHRLAWTLANGTIPEGLCLCHRCDTPACVRPDHLFLGTRADNLADMRAKGRYRPPVKGTFGRGRRSTDRLTEDDVREIRRRHAAGESLKQLGRAFDYHFTNISAIVHRRLWARVS